MKNKIAKILGVVLTTVVVASLFVFAVPASAAPTPQAWNILGTPSTTGMVLNTTITVGGPIAQASDASALYAYVLDGGTNKIIKSTDAGRTWKKSGTVGQPLATVLEIVASPTEPNVVFYITSTTLYKSADAGATFLPVVAVPATDAFTALDVAKWSGRYIAVVGVNSILGGATMLAGVYYWDESLPFNNLTPVGTTTFGAYNVLSVKMAPTFGVDRAVVAIGVDAVSATTIRVDVNGGAWGAIVADAVIGAGAAATAADIAFPSDFNATLNPIYFVTIADADAADGGIYRLIGNVPTVVQTDDFYTNLSISGAFNAGAATILAGGSGGQVRLSTNSGFSWGGTTAVALRSSVATTAWVLLDVNYPTSKLAYVLNVGLVQGAFNVSIDSSVTFNQWSLINDTLTAIADLAIASNGDMFMLSNNGVDTSIWRTLVSPSTPWERVKLNLGAINDIIRAAVDYATSKAVYYTTSGSNAAIQQSTNSANKFSAMLSAPGSIVAPADAVLSLVALSASQVVVGSAAGIITTNTSSFWWVESAPFGGTFNVTDIKSAGGTNVVAVATDTAGLVQIAKSADNGVTWTLALKPGSTTTVASIAIVTPNAYIAAADDYATTGNIFVTTRNAGLWRYPSTATVAVNGWLNVDTTAATGTGYGIVAAPGGPGSTTEGSGMIYTTHANTVGVADRLRGTERVVENILAAASTSGFTGIWAGAGNSAGNVTFYTLGSTASGPALFFYIDTLGIPGTGVAISNLFTNLAVVPTSACTITWNALPNALNYEIYVNTVRQNSVYSAVNSAGVIVAYTAGATTATVTGMAPGTTYYVSVWAARATNVVPGPVSSFLFGGNTSFQTPLAVPVTPMNLVPVLGATNVPVQPNFAWTTVSGATSYTLQITLATDAAFASPVYNNAIVPVVTGPTATFNYTGTALLNNTSYIWRVKANGTGPSDWVYGNFTTIPVVVPPVTVTQAAPAPVPTIILSNPPQVTVTQAAPVPTPVFTLPQPNITIAQPEAVTPTYIWIIVGVGALLTLAVIILIIRTRRVV